MRKQIYCLPLLFCLRGKNLRQPFLFLSSLWIKFLFAPEGKTIYFEAIVILFISFVKGKKNPDDVICGPQRMKPPPGSGSRPLANSSYEGVLSHPCVLSQ